MTTTSTEDWKVLAGNPRSLWLQYRMAPFSVAYHCTWVASITGDISPERFKPAFDALCTRHPTLRTLFADDEMGVRFRFAETHCNEVLQIDGVTTIEEAEQRLLAEAGRPLTLDRGQVARFAWARAEDRWIMMMVVHHIVTDFYSCELLARELTTLLSDEELPEPGDYVGRCIDDDAYAASSRADDDRSYWHNLLEGAPPVLDLATDKARSSRRGWDGNRIEVVLDEGIRDRVLKLARDLKTTPYVVLLAACQLWLWRLGGQDDFVIGTPTLGRHAASHRHIVGYLANPMAVRARPLPDQSFAAMVEEVKAQASMSRRHQRYPTSKLAEERPHPGGNGRAPMFQHFFTYSQMRDDWGRAIDWRFHHMTMLGAAHELILTVIEYRDQYRCSVGYNGGLYTPQTVRLSLDGYLSILDVATRAPETAIGEIGWSDPADVANCVLPVATRHALDRLEQTAGARTALVEGMDDTSYAALLREAQALAGSMQCLAAGPIVGLALPRGRDLIVAMIATWYAGKGWLALDPNLPGPRLAFMLEDSGTNVVIGMGEKPAWLGRETTWLPADARASDPLLTTTRSPGDIAYLIYTSGSTGQPKGVAVTHDNLCHYVEGVLDRIEPDTSAILTSLATVSADLGHTALFGALLSGRTFRLIDDATARDPSRLAEHLQKHPVDLLKIVPSHLAALLAMEHPERLLPRRQLVFGGDTLSWRLVDRLAQLAPELELFNHYGPTETTIGATCIRVSDAPRETGSVAIGRPIANGYARVLDRHDRPVPIGAIGELYIGGKGVAAGYWNKPDLTAERFVADPLDSAAIVYRTGDRVQRLPEGVLLFHGRADDQVKIRGFRVEPSEIALVLERMPGIDHAIVLAAEQQGDLRLLAFYRGTHPDVRGALAAELPEHMVPRHCLAVTDVPLMANGKVDRDALIDLAASQAHDDVVDNVPLDAFEERLAALWQALFPDAVLHAGSSFFSLGGDSIQALTLVARAKREGLALTPAMLVETPVLRDLAERLRPDAAVRSALRHLWVGILGPGADTPDADFFAHGGDSISALTLVARARREGLVFSPADLLAHRTVAALATFVGADADPSTAASASSAVPFSLLETEEVANLRAAHPEAVDAWPLSPLQEGLLFATLSGREGGAYVSQQVIGLTGHLDIGRFADAWRRLVGRHDSLRVGFDWHHAGRPVQWDPGESLACFELMDWSDVDAAAFDEQFESFRRSEQARPFDLERPGMLRAHLVTHGNSHKLLLTVHHLVVDGWSASVLFDDLFALYRSDLPGEAPRHRDYIAWLSAQPKDRDDSFWREQMAGYEAGEPLPPAESPRSGYHQIDTRFEPAVTESLAKVAADIGVPLTSLIQAGWALLLARYTNAADICFGLTVSGRSPEFPAVERTAGLFINTLPMRLHVDDELNFRDLCIAARDISFAVQAHDSLPISRVAQLAGAPGVDSLFDTLLLIENFAATSAGVLESGVEFHAERVRVSTHLPLMIQFTPEPGGLHLKLQGRADRLDNAFVEQVLADWQRLVSDIPSWIDRPLRSWSLVAPDDEAAWRDRGSGPLLPFLSGAQPASLADPIEAAAQRWPSSPALHGPDRTLSYEELDRAANRLAHDLLANGVRGGISVALVADRSEDSLVAMLAILKAGGAYVPLDPEFPDARLRHIVDDAGCRLVLGQGEILGRIATPDCQAYDLSDPEITGRCLTRPDTRPSVERDIEAPAYIIYTSGSTGQPKGVVVPHRGPLHLMVAVHAHMPAQPGDRVLQFTGLHFDMSVLEWLCAWTQGACLHVCTRDTTRSSERLLTQLAEERVTHVVAQPAVFAAIEPVELPSLRFLLLGGDVCPDVVAEGWGRGRTFLNGYGPTEASVIVTADTHCPGVAIRLGKPLPHARCHVLDRAGRACPPGVVGELHLAGSYLALGYHGMPERTAAAFRSPDVGPLAGTRLYATGDRARLGFDGRLDFLGRRDNQVKIRGYRIEPGEIEAALRSCPGVRDAAVLVHRETQDDARLVAFVQGQASAAALRAELGQQLPAYMIPVHIECRPELPQSASRKLDRRALAAEIPRLLKTAVPELPVTETERQIHALWQAMFDRESIGVTDDFFALGGHSLLATRLASAITREFGFRLDLRRLFATSTIRQQAALIDAIRPVVDEADPELIVEAGYL